jgi:CshA-type fibril repeat protein
MTGTYVLNNIPVKNTTPNPAVLVAWIDFNHNGTFESTEGISVPVAVNATSVNLSWTIPNTVTTGGVQVRLRLSTDINNLTTSTPTAAMIDGEAEDYLFPPAVISGSIWNDKDADGLTETGEPAVQPGTLYANLIKDGIVIEQVAVSDGTYSLNAPVNTNGLSVVLSTNAVADGAAVGTLTTTAPTGYSYTKDNIGGTPNSATSGTAQSSTNNLSGITTTTANLVAYNIGVKNNLTPFACTDGVSYLISGAPSVLSTVNLKTGGLTTLFSASTLGSINMGALGYNPLDNYLYASALISGVNNVVRIGADGSTQLIPLAGLGTTAFTSGDVGPDGTLYLFTAPGTVIYKVNLASMAVTTITVASTSPTDFSISADGSTILAISANTGNFLSYNSATGAAIANTAVGLAAGNYATFLDNNGDLYAVNPAGTTFKVASPFGAGSGSQVSGTGGLSLLSTDGAKCPTAKALLTYISLSGALWNDANANGLTSTGEVAFSPATTYANLVQNGVVIDRIAITNGTYTLPNVPASTSGLSVVMSSNLVNYGTASSTLTTTAPTGYVYTLDNIGGVPNTATAGTAQATSNSLAVTTGTTNLTNYNVGIQFGPATAFSCSSNLAYQVAGPTGGPNILYSYNVGTGIRTAIGSTGVNANAIAYNPLDNLIWGIDQTSSNLIRIDATGTSVSVPIANLPLGSPGLAYNVGAMLPNGYLFITITNNTRYYVIDVNPSRPTYLQLVDPTIGYAIDAAPDYGTALSTSLHISDWVYNSTTGNLMALVNPIATVPAGSAVKVASIVPTTGVVTLSATAVTSPVVATFSIQNEGNGYGAIFYDAAGNAYVFANNQGRFYNVNLATNTATLVSTSITSGNNDGASCPTSTLFTAPITISGSLWNDANGNGLTAVGENAISSVTTYANLVQNGVVISQTTLTAGAYTLTNVPANTSGLTIVMSSNAVTVGAASSTLTTSAPSGYGYTLDNIGGVPNTATAGTAQATTNSLSVSTGTTNLTDYNVGIALATAYIYVHKSALNEESSTNFPFTTDFGSSFSLNDQDDILNTVDIGAGTDRLFAVADVGAGIYQRINGSSQWTSVGGGNAVAVDGGALGRSVHANTTGVVYYHDGSAFWLMSGNVGATDVAYDRVNNRIFYCGSGGTVFYKTPTASNTTTGWTQVGGITAKRIDASSTGDVLVTVGTDNNVYTSTLTGTLTFIGRPGTVSAVQDVTRADDGNIYIQSGQQTVWKYTGGAWTEEPTSRGGQYVTSGAGSQIWETQVNTPTGVRSIWTRTGSSASIGVWLDDERVRTSTANSNSVMLAVAPGTHTITESAVANWALQGITIYDPTSNSTTDTVNRSATINVASGEIVHVTFQNGLFQTSTVSKTCGTTFLENFGVNATIPTTLTTPLTGLTSYHWQGSLAGAVTDGYYKVIQRSDDAGYGATQSANYNTLLDHTTDVGGYYLFVNANYQSDVFYRRRFTNLIVGASYTLKYWVMNVTGNTSAGPKVNPGGTTNLIPINVKASVAATDGSVLASNNTGNITTVGTWQEQTFTFTATQTDVDLFLSNNGIGGSGNDVGIDDITFGLDAAAQPVTTTTAATCGGTATITVTSPLGVAYEYSIDGSTYQTSVTFAGLAPGTYPVTARYVGSTSCVSTINNVVINPIICGNIFNDISGNAVKDGAEPFITNGSVWVNLVNPTTNAVIQSVQVDASGNYAFTSTAANTNYKVILSTSDQTGVTNLTTASVPTGFVSTGVNLNNTANTTNQTGIITVAVGTANVSNQNFAIEALPLAGSGSNTAINPGGVNQAIVPLNTFTNTTASSDPTPGAVTGIRITQFPAGATSIVVNGVTYTNTPASIALLTALIIPTTNNSIGQPNAGTTITVDPATEGATTVTIPFVSIDAAGKESALAGNAVMNFTGISISGTVFNDANGMSDNTVNGTAVNLSGLNALLIDAVTGKVVATTTVATDGSGSYSFPSASIGNYNVMITTNTGVLGENPPAVALPSGWVNTGEHLGTGTGTQTPIDGILPLGSVTITTTDANFGIEQPPVANNDISLNNTAGTPVTINPLTNDTDADGTLDGTKVSLVNPGGANINSTDANGDILSMTVANEGTWTVEPVTGEITFTPQPGFFGNPSPINYNVEDNASKQSNDASITITYTAPIVISGTIFNDANGNTIINSGENFTALPATQYVYLVNAAGIIVNSVSVNPDGSYNLNAAPNTAYTLELSGVSYPLGTNTNITPINTNPPAGYLTTGENGNGSSDGAPDGKLSITTGTGPATSQNFGFEQPPVANNDASTGNTPGTAVTINPLTNDTDATPGTLDGTKVSLVNPGGGATVNSTDSNGDILSITIPNLGTWTVDPVSGEITFTPQPGFYGNPTPINYDVEDNAGKQSNDATITITYLASQTITGTVFNDADGDVTIDAGENGTEAASSTLTAYLVNASGNVLSSSDIAADGTYTLGGAVNGTNYTVRLCNTAGATVGNPAPAAALPAGWVNTGEAFGTNNNAGSGTEITTPGVIAVTPNGNVSGVNFGIEQPPVANNDGSSGNTSGTPVTINPLTNDTDVAPGTLDATKVSLVNPGGATSVVTDANGDITSMTITGQGTWSVNATTGEITFTPQPGFFGDPTPINYNVEDNASKQSNNATVTISYQPASTITGTVFNDADGDVTKEAGENGTEAGSSTLTAYLVDGSGNVVSSSDVDANGIYTLTGAINGVAYTVRLSNTAGVTAGNTAPAAALPTGWVNTGEDFGNNNNAGGGTEISTPGVIAVTPNGNVAGVNFGIEQPPVANNDASLNHTPGTPVTVNPLTNDTDVAPGTLDDTKVSLVNPGSATINTTDANGDILSMTVANEGTWTVDPVTGEITFTPQPGFYGNPTPIDYNVEDNASKQSNNATVTITYLPTISGIVYNDANGGTIDGTPISSAGSTPLYANLVSNGSIVGVVPITGGRYLFTGSNGLVAGQDYTVVLSPTQGQTGQAPSTLLPISSVADWINTAEGTGTGDGTPNGVIAVTAPLSGTSQADFGIERLPKPTPNLIANFNGTVVENQQYPLGPLSSQPSLSGTDPEDGAIGATQTVAITSLPEGGKLYYNGVEITSASATDPFVITGYNPDNLTFSFNNTSVLQTSFQFKVVDAAGEISTTEGTYTINASTILPVTGLQVKAVLVSGTPNVSWTTLTEQGTRHFAVERSIDGTQFTTVATVAAAGNSNSLRSYSYTDKTLSGTNIVYYRIRMLDLDGRATLSNIAGLALSASPLISVFPNPAKDFVTVAGITGKSEIRLLDINGRLLLKENTANSTLYISLKGYAAGTYLIQVIDEGKKITTRRIVKE